VTEINTAKHSSEELLVHVNHLLPQLSSSAPAMTLEQLSDLLDSSAVTLFVATHEGRTVGMLTLALFPIPTGIRAWIEDVVVDADARGLGVGALLTTTAVEHAKHLGAVTVDLTSRPAREAANALYRKVGFAQRETNVYRFLIENESGLDAPN
jgi:ribosomal protein S18 acetylase RimI-like enzyme